MRRQKIGCFAGGRRVSFVKHTDKIYKINKSQDLLYLLSITKDVNAVEFQPVFIINLNASRGLTNGIVYAGNDVF